jgi:hypothetical protein
MGLKYFIGVTYWAALNKMLSSKAYKPRWIRIEALYPRRGARENSSVWDILARRITTGRLWQIRTISTFCT